MPALRRLSLNKRAGYVFEGPSLKNVLSTSLQLESLEKKAAEKSPKRLADSAAYIAFANADTREKREAFLLQYGPVKACPFEAPPLPQFEWEHFWKAADLERELLEGDKIEHFRRPMKTQEENVLWQGCEVLEHEQRVMAAAVSFVSLWRRGERDINRLWKAVQDLGLAMVARRDSTGDPDVAMKDVIFDDLAAIDCFDHVREYHPPAKRDSSATASGNDTWDSSWLITAGARLICKPINLNRRGLQSKGDASAVTISPEGAPFGERVLTRLYQQFETDVLTHVGERAVAVCPDCKMFFVLARLNKKYCSDACRTRAWERQKKRTNRPST